MVFMVAVQIHLDLKPCQKVKDSLTKLLCEYKEFLRDISSEIILEGRVTPVSVR